ncbi:DUF6799 domain-containing protein [Haloferula sp. BvORR071]|uniref:DUF6799 domain-containing protein n=1 Tax=Haloferula sp. BvORR071 TaxID=1396141 RepID=UPI002240EA50|nr:DUF6799 domain-containing protein [Haloferula sp. BvORR071]
MKTPISKTGQLLIAILAASMSLAVAKDGVAMKDGKVVTVKDGNKTELTDEATLKDGTKVMKDGRVVSPDGTKWSLKNGEMIDWDGKFSVHFVMDGVVRKDGKIWLIKAGEKSEVSGETTLTDGTKVQADGNVVSKENKKWEMDDGDAILSDGRPVVEGSIVGWGEKPLLTDDCSGTLLKSDKSFPNGNKVQPDGTILFSDGNKGKIKDLDVIQEGGTYLPAIK